MKVDDFLALPAPESEAIFNKVAAENGMSAFAVEKDWWVSRSLEVVFGMKISEHLVFKGGTSLSKAWKLIQRFSEDIDLAIDRRFFGFSESDISNSGIKRLRKEAGAYTSGIFLSDVKNAFVRNGFLNLDIHCDEPKESDQDPRIIEIHYPNVIPLPSAYIQPRVQIEISCRSLIEPFTDKEIISLVDEVFAGREFTRPAFNIPSVLPERTFLEKLCLLHEEFQRPPGKIRVNRLSRHLYDVYQLARSGIGKNALADKELYEAIVFHRFRFSKVSGVDYRFHHPHHLNPVPSDEIAEAWKADYARMKEEMIYGHPKPEFEELMAHLKIVQAKLKEVKWNFELNFA